MLNRSPRFFDAWDAFFAGFAFFAVRPSPLVCFAGMGAIRSACSLGAACRPSCPKSSSRHFDSRLLYTSVGRSGFNVFFIFCYRRNGWPKFFQSVPPLLWVRQPAFSWPVSSNGHSDAVSFFIAHRSDAPTPTVFLSAHGCFDRPMVDCLVFRGAGDARCASVSAFGFTCVSAEVSSGYRLARRVCGARSSFVLIDVLGPTHIARGRCDFSCRPARRLVWPRTNLGYRAKYGDRKPVAWRWAASLFSSLESHCSASTSSYLTVGRRVGDAGDCSCGLFDLFWPVQRR